MRTVVVKSAARVLDLLEALAALRDPIGVNEIARRLAMPKSSASALIATLQARGYVVSGAGGVVLAEACRNVGWVGGETAALQRCARPIMQRLSQSTGESCFLGVPTAAFEVLYVDKAVSDSALRYDAELAMLRPAYCTSIGLVLLGGLSESGLDAYFAGRALVPVTPRTVTDVNRIRAAIAIGRKRGYVRISDSHVLGASGVAAPVVANGRVIAGLAVIAPSDRFSRQAALNVKLTVDAAGDLSRALGMRSA